MSAGLNVFTIDDLGPDGVTVAPVPWARAVDATNGNGKVNISDKGGEQTVFVEDTTNATVEPPAKRRRLNPATGAAQRLRRRPEQAPYRLRSLYDAN